MAGKDLASVVPEALVAREGLVAREVLEDRELRGDEVVDLVVKVVMPASDLAVLMGLNVARRFVIRCVSCGWNW